MKNENFSIFVRYRFMKIGSFWVWQCSFLSYNHILDIHFISTFLVKSQPYIEIEFQSRVGDMNFFHLSFLVCQSFFISRIAIIILWSKVVSLHGAGSSNYICKPEFPEELLQWLSNNSIDRKYCQRLAKTAMKLAEKQQNERSNQFWAILLVSMKIIIFRFVSFLFHHTGNLWPIDHDFIEN